MNLFFLHRKQTYIFGLIASFFPVEIFSTILKNNEKFWNAKLGSLIGVRDSLKGCMKPRVGVETCWRVSADGIW